MDLTGILILIGFLLFFGLLIYFAFTSARKEAAGKQQAARSLGFTTLQPDAELSAEITQLYLRPGEKGRYELRHVARRLIPDGEMFLFDLVETSSEDDSWREQQAVAIRSPDLRLPHFVLFPKTDEKVQWSGLANKLVEWGMSRIGSPVAFPEAPAFNARYVVNSRDPAGARGYLDERLLDYFARTQMCALHAGGDIFTVSEMDPEFKPRDQNSMTQRINRALDIFRLFRD